MKRRNVLNISIVNFIIIPLSTLCFSSLSIAELIHKEPSLYQDIYVEENEGTRCLRFNVRSKNINQSCMNIKQPKKLVFNYTKLLFSGLMLNSRPKNILIIGLGAGTMSNALHDILPSAKITNVEIDPAMIKVAREHFSFIENEKVNVISQDGRLFVKRARLKKLSFDWIILDAFNGDYIPEHLMTQEFLLEAKALLKSDGILSSNTFVGSRLYDFESATYHSVFGEFYNIRSVSNENRIILVGNQALYPIQENLASQNDFKQLSVSLKPYGIVLGDILNVMNLTTDNHDWPNDTKILTDQYSPVNLLSQQSSP